MGYTWEDDYRLNGPLKLEYDQNMGLKILDEKKKKELGEKAKEVCKRLEKKDTTGEFNKDECIDRMTNKLEEAWIH